MSGYAPADWHEFFVAAVGASAALLGLLFVTISINLEQILKHRHLPGRAAGTLGTLLSVLVVCSFGLAPGQSNRTLGVEILATGAVVATQPSGFRRASGVMEIHSAGRSGTFRFSYSPHLPR